MLTTVLVLIFHLMMMVSFLIHQPLVINISYLHIGVLDTAEGSGRDILRAKIEHKLAETVCCA